MSLLTYSKKKTEEFELNESYQIVLSIFLHDMYLTDILLIA